MAMMTIDEAIKKYKEKSEFFKKTTNVSYALELEQIVKWLEELKRRRLKDGEMIGSGALNNAYNQGYNKAIDDFVEAIDKEDRKECLVMDMFEIENIAEQLKKGGTDE